MSPTKNQIRLADGSFVDAVDLDFDIESDPETKVKLKDGSEIRIKVAVGKVTRLENMNDQVTGDPLYYIQSQPIIRVIANPALKKFNNPPKE